MHDTIYRLSAEKLGIGAVYEPCTASLLVLRRQTMSARANSPDKSGVRQSSLECLRVYYSLTHKKVSAK